MLPLIVYKFDELRQMETNLTFSKVQSSYTWKLISVQYLAFTTFVIVLIFCIKRHLSYKFNQFLLKNIKNYLY